MTIGNVIPGTVTGNSDTADYKDVVLADVADSVTISQLRLGEGHQGDRPRWRHR